MEHKGTIRLETENLILRPFVLSDAEQVYANWACDDEVTKYLTWPSHPSVDASRGYMQYCINGYADPTCYQWGIELKSTGALVGNISVTKIEDHIEAVELGWVIGRNWWGQGIMPEAAAKVIEFLFQEVGANRICAAHDVDNPKSGRVMQKVGMKQEGILRQAGRNNQGIVDMAYYSILKEEFH